MDSEVQPFRVTVYDEAFGRTGWVGNPVTLAVTPRWNALGTAEFTVPTDHPYASRCVAEGARAVVELDTSWDVAGAAPTWEHLVGGPVRQWDLEGVGTDPRVVCRVEDDWRLLARVLGWQVPASPISAQSGAEYRTITGPAETVVKTLMAENAVTRLGLPVTVATDLGRGDTITVSVRMHPTVDRLLPAIEQAGIGVTVVQSGAGLLVDVREPVTHPRVLTVASGALRSAKVTRTAATLTRAVAGGGGEGTARIFRALVDTDLEAATGDVIEGFVDARDTSDPAVMDARLAQALAEAGPRSGISLTLADTPSLRYGRDMVVGDVVCLDVDGVVVTDTLRSATLTWSAADGVLAVPQVGDRTDDPDQDLARVVARIARAQRDIARR